MQQILFLVASNCRCLDAECSRIFSRIPSDVDSWDIVWNLGQGDTVQCNAVKVMSVTVRFVINFEASKLLFSYSVHRKTKGIHENFHAIKKNTVSSMLLRQHIVVSLVLTFSELKCFA